MTGCRSATVLAALVLALAPGAASPAAAAPPAAARTGAVRTAATGACTDATGVSVVVDARAVGGVLSVRCVSDAAGLTGLDALKGAGFSVEGTQRFGESFVCRIAGLPSAGQRLNVEGTGSYRETCVDTPPAAASWSYWYATDGGSWQYSHYGAKAREVVPGGFEGWVFSLNQPTGSPAVPGVTPKRPTATGGEPGAAGGGRGGGGDRPSSGGGKGAGPLPAPKPRAKASAPTTAPTSAAAADDPKPASAAQEQTGGASTVAPFAAGGLLVLLGAVAAVTARRRAGRED